MIEFLAFLGFTIIQATLKHNVNAETYALTVSSLTSLLIVFILFARVFLKVCMDRLLDARIRFRLLSWIYILLLTSGCCAVMYFSGDFERPYGAWPVIKIIIQVILYLNSIFMFTIVKFLYLKEHNLYGKSYLFCHILDTVIIFLLLLFDFLIKPSAIMKNNNNIIIIEFLLFNLAVVNIICVHFLEYWKHHQTLLKMLENIIKSNKEEILVKPQKKDLEADNIMKELVVVLDQSPIRIIELNSLVAYVRETLIKNGRETEKATEFIAKFSSVLIANLMKRRWDFSYLPSVINNTRQIYFNKKNSNNIRGQK